MSTVFNKLTSKQLQVAELCLRGFSYTEIADALKLRPNTVKSHQKNIYDRLDINSRRELFALAEKRGKSCD